MKRQMRWWQTTVFSLLAGAMVCACSSAPKRAMLVRETATAASNYFEIANNELAAGQIEQAGMNLQKAYTLATSVDDADLLCRISLSAVIYRLSVASIDITAVTALSSKNETPFAGLSSELLLERAETFAKRTNRADTLLSVHQIYVQKNAITKRGTSADFSAVHSALNQSEKELAKEPYYLAFLYRTRGDVYELQQNYAQADASFVAAAELHFKERYLYEIGIDWFSAARARSKAGNKDSAIAAMENALKYDRDAENTPAIASDYLAIARILAKATTGTPTEQETSRAIRAARWAADIYEAGHFVSEAAEATAFADRLEFGTDEQAENP